MTHEEKVEFFRIGSNLVNVGINSLQADLLISMYEAVLEKKGELTLRDASKIASEAESRANAKSRSKLLDKFSTEV
jgi:hypothetical protein